MYGPHTHSHEEFPVIHRAWFMSCPSGGPRHMGYKLDQTLTGTFGLKASTIYWPFSQTLQEFLFLLDLVT